MHDVISGKINIQRSPKTTQREAIVEMSADRNTCCDSSHGAICCAEKSNDMPQPGSLPNENKIRALACFSCASIKVGLERVRSSLLSTRLVSYTKWNMYSATWSCCAKIQESTLIWRGLRHMSHAGLKVDGHSEYKEATPSFSIPGRGSEKAFYAPLCGKTNQCGWNVHSWWSRDYAQKLTNKMDWIFIL